MKIIVKRPNGKHVRTLIILHGMNQDERDLDVIIKLIKNKRRGTKIILPIADPLYIKWPDCTGEIINSWYNYYTRYDNMVKHDTINIGDFNKNTVKIKEIIENECSFIDPSKIFLCGISQGGTIAIDASLKLKFKINSILCIDTIFMHSYFDYINFSDISQKFIVHQSKNDEIYNTFFQDYCYSVLKNYGHTIEKFMFESSHTECMADIADFISSKITKK